VVLNCDESYSGIAGSLTTINIYLGGCPAKRAGMLTRNTYLIAVFILTIMVALASGQDSSQRQSDSASPTDEKFLWQFDTGG
jgi:hypothetical protein